MKCFRGGRAESVRRDGQDQNSRDKGHRVPRITMPTRTSRWQARSHSGGTRGSGRVPPRALPRPPPSQMLGDCTVIRLAAGFRPDPLGELVRSPRTSSRNGGIYTSKKREGRRGRVGGLLLRRGKEEEGFFI